MNELEQMKRELAEKWADDPNMDIEYNELRAEIMFNDLTALLDKQREVIKEEQEQEFAELKKKLGLMKESMKNNETHEDTDDSKSSPAKQLNP